MVDGLGGGLGQIGSTGIGSGAVGAREIEDASIVAADLGTDAVVTAKISGLSVTTAKIAATAVTAAKQGFVGTGSPTGYGLSIQAGTVTASNVAVNTNFGTAFAAAPTITFGVGVSGEAATQPGCVVDANGGSFQFLGQSGLSYNWLAVGSGNI